jgi:hypothetical protein
VLALRQVDWQTSPGVETHKNWVAKSGFFEKFKIARDFEDEAALFSKFIILADSSD